MITNYQKYKYLNHYHRIIYYKDVGNFTIKGYDISDINPVYKVAEVILLDGLAIQVRKLVDNPYHKDSIQFGGF